MIMKKIIFFFLIALTFTLHATDRPKHIDRKIWKQVAPYLIPDEHPIKPILDKIFSSRATLNRRTMRHAGFKKTEIRRWTHIVVSTHPDLPGYIFKIYLDAQCYHNNCSEHKHWTTRVRGARAVQKILDKKQWNHLFKVPKKWIYALPEYPKPPDEFLRKNFILVEEKFDLVNEKENKKAWRKWITKEHLDALYYILKSTGLRDCIKIHNIPFSIDGRISFIDTDSYKKGGVPYSKLNEHLSQKMQQYWFTLR